MDSSHHHTPVKGKGASTRLNRRKKPPATKKAEPMTFWWTPSPFLTSQCRPGSGRPTSALRPPKSIQMTLHYSRERIDAESTVVSVSPSRPRSSGTLGLGTSTDSFGRSESHARRPATARDDLRGMASFQGTPKFGTGQRLKLSMPGAWSAFELADQLNTSKDVDIETERYQELLTKAEEETGRMVASERQVTKNV
jgi:hypothetical protein